MAAHGWYSDEVLVESTGRVVDGAMVHDYAASQPPVPQPPAAAAPAPYGAPCSSACPTCGSGQPRQPQQPLAQWGPNSSFGCAPSAPAQMQQHGCPAPQHGQYMQGWQSGYGAPQPPACSTPAGAAPLPTPSPPLPFQPPSPPSPALLPPATQQQQRLTRRAPKAQPQQAPSAPPSEAAEGAARRDRTVYGVSIDSLLPERELIAFLSSFGPLAKARLCGHTANRTVYGFFEFVSRDAAERLVSGEKWRLGRSVALFSWAKSKIKDKRSERGTQMRVLSLAGQQVDGDRGASSVAIRDSPLSEANIKARRVATRRSVDRHVDVINQSVIAQDKEQAAAALPAAAQGPARCDALRVQVHGAADSSPRRVWTPSPSEGSGPASGSSQANTPSAQWADDDDEMDFSVPVEVAMAHPSPPLSRAASSGSIAGTPNSSSLTHRQQPSQPQQPQQQQQQQQWPQPQCQQPMLQLQRPSSVMLAPHPAGHSPHSQAGA